MSVLSLLIQKINDRDDDVYSLYLNDWTFRKAYDMMCDSGETDELIVDLIVKLCMLKIEIMSEYLKLKAEHFDPSLISNKE